MPGNKAGEMENSAVGNKPYKTKAGLETKEYGNFKIRR
jgi:hypothetical protein